MNKKIAFEVIENKHIKKSPFDFIIYKLAKTRNIIIENPYSGKSIFANDSEINKYFEYTNFTSDWKSLPDDKCYVKISNDYLFYFKPLFEDDIKFLNFNIILRKQPIEILNKLSTNFEVENFSLIKDENPEVTYLTKLIISAKLPLFRTFVILKRMDSNYYKNRKDNTLHFIGMLGKNGFYRIPYGNIHTNDSICLGKHISENDAINDFYIKFITTNFNDDMIFHLKYNNKAEISLDLEKIKEKINNNNFDNSLIDSLYYLSQCDETNLNENIFLLTPNIPKEIYNNDTKEWS